MCSKTDFKKHLKNNLLLILTIISVIIGTGLGSILRIYVNLNQVEKEYFSFPGEIFLRILKFILFPLIGSSLASSIWGIQKKKIGKIAIQAVMFYSITTISAILVAVVLSIAINPGKRSFKSLTNESEIFNISKLNIEQKYLIINTIFDLIRNIFPDNMIQIGFQVYESKIDYKNVINTTDKNYSNITILNDLEIKSGSRVGMNIVGLALYTVIFALVAAKMGNKSQVLFDLLEVINESCITIIKRVMWYSPIGNCFLICNVVLNIQDLNELFQSIPFYILTMFVSLIIQGLFVSLIYLIFTRQNILRYAKNLFAALVMAFATSSSVASLPVTLKCVEEKNKVPKIISRFMLTVGTSINVDGTTMYTLIAALFIAQLNKIEMSLIDYFVVSITAAFASIGSAGIPAGATLALLASLNALNIPVREISIFISLDWLMDRFYTVHNVWGASVGTAVLAHYNRKKLENQELIESSGEKVDSLETTIVDNQDCNTKL